MKVVVANGDINVERSKEDTEEDQNKAQHSAHSRKQMYPKVHFCWKKIKLF